MFDKSCLISLKHFFMVLNTEAKISVSGYIPNLVISTWSVSNLDYFVLNSCFFLWSNSPYVYNETKKSKKRSMKHQKLDFFFHQTSIDHHHHHHHHIVTIVIIIIDNRSLSSFVVLSVTFAWRANQRVSFPPARRIPEKRASASRESAIYHSNSFVPCSPAGSMYLLVSACSFFCRYSTEAILHKLSDLPKGALAIF